MTRTLELKFVTKIEVESRQNVIRDAVRGTELLLLLLGNRKVFLF